MDVMNRDGVTGSVTMNWQNVPDCRRDVTFILTWCTLLSRTSCMPMASFQEWRRHRTMLQSTVLDWMVKYYSFSNSTVSVHGNGSEWRKTLQANFIYFRILNCNQFYFKNTRIWEYSVCKNLLGTCNFVTSTIRTAAGRRCDKLTTFPIVIMNFV